MVGGKFNVPVHNVDVCAPTYLVLSSILSPNIVVSPNTFYFRGPLYVEHFFGFKKQLIKNTKSVLNNKNLQTQDCEEGKATQEDISTVMVVYTRNNPRPIMHGIASRVRRMLCLLTLLAGIVMPTILRIFFIADNKSRLTHNNWESLEADAFFSANDYYADSVDAEADAKSSSSSTIMTTSKEYRRNTHDYFTRINAGHDYESNRMLMSEAAMEYQKIDQKRSIHVIVTTVIAFLLPSLVFLYAFIFQKETQGSIVRSLNKRSVRRKERILLQGLLQECRIQLPTTTTIPPEDTTSVTTDDDDSKRRECPICLLAFTAGDMVIASKHCHCSSIRTKIACSVAKNNYSSIQSQFYHRIFFHEQCIFTWLSQRKTNPKKLCPCCRQPFLESKQQVVRSS